MRHMIDQGYFTTRCGISNDSLDELEKTNVTGWVTCIECTHHFSEKQKKPIRGVAQSILNGASGKIETLLVYLKKYPWAISRETKERVLVVQDLLMEIDTLDRELMRNLIGGKG